MLNTPEEPTDSCCWGCLLCLLNAGLVVWLSVAAVRLFMG
jgi:hypothetical protein